MHVEDFRSSQCKPLFVATSGEMARCMAVSAPLAAERLQANKGVRRHLFVGGGLANLFSTEKPNSEGMLVSQRFGVIVLIVMCFKLCLKV